MSLCPQRTRVATMVRLPVCNRGFATANSSWSRRRPAGGLPCSHLRFERKRSPHRRCRTRFPPGALEDHCLALMRITSTWEVGSMPIPAVSEVERTRFDELRCNKVCDSACSRIAGLLPENDRGHSARIPCQPGRVQWPAREYPAQMRICVVPQSRNIVGGAGLQGTELAGTA